jgi:hypothetical protein
MKPILYVSMSENGKLINETRVKHPTSPPQWGGVWATYAPVNSNLGTALANNELLTVRLKTLRDIFAKADQGAVKRILIETETSSAAFRRALQGGK